MKFVLPVESVSTNKNVSFMSKWFKS